jgi:hypothetical protein
MHEHAEYVAKHCRQDTENDGQADRRRHAGNGPFGRKDDHAPEGHLDIDDVDRIGIDWLHGCCSLSLRIPLDTAEGQGERQGQACRQYRYSL